MDKQQLMFSFCQELREDPFDRFSLFKIARLTEQLAIQIQDRKTAETIIATAEQECRDCAVPFERASDPRLCQAVYALGVHVLESLQLVQRMSDSVSQYAHSPIRFDYEVSEEGRQWLIFKNEEGAEVERRTIADVRGFRFVSEMFSQVQRVLANLEQI